MAEADEDDLVENSGTACNDDDSSGVKAESEAESESGERSPSPLPAPVKPEAFEEDFYPVNPGMFDGMMPTSRCKVAHVFAGPLSLLRQKY